MTYMGDFRRGSIVDIPWHSFTSLGGSVTRSSNGTVIVFRGTTSSASTQVGVTDNEDFASITGCHIVRVSTGSTTNFFVPHSDYHVIMSGDSIDGQLVNHVIGSFSIENRFGGEVLVGVAQGSTATSVTLPTTASATTDFYKGGRVFVSHGTGQLQEGDIISYAGASQVAVVSRTWVTTPGSADTVVVLPGAYPTDLSEVTAAIDSLDYFTTTEANSGVTVTAASMSAITAGLPTLAQINSGVTMASSLVTVNANLQQINDVTLTGDGSTTSWGPV